MKRPRIIWVIFTSLLLFGVGNTYLFIKSTNYAHIIFVVLPCLGAIGLVFYKKWSQYIIYFIFLLIGASFTFNNIMSVYKRGWTQNNAFANILSVIIPNVLVALLCIGFSISVFKYFRKGINTKPK